MGCYSDLLLGARDLLRNLAMRDERFLLKYYVGSQSAVFSLEGVFSSTAPTKKYNWETTVGGVGNCY